MIKENPARVVPTPKLPKRVPSVLSAEEMNLFLNELAGAGPTAAGGRMPAEKLERAGGRTEGAGGGGILVRRDRALLGWRDVGGGGLWGASRFGLWVQVAQC